MLAVEVVLSQKAKDVPRGAMVVVGRVMVEVADNVRDPVPKRLVPDMTAEAESDASYT